MFRPRSNISLVEPWEASETARSADSSTPPNYLVVINALDEINGNDGSMFLKDLFIVINKGQLRGLKFFATSRPDPNLITRVKSFGKKRLYGLQDVGEKEVQADIN